jgi:hypothetical protein
MASESNLDPCLDLWADLEGRVCAKVSVFDEVHEQYSTSSPGAIRLLSQCCADERGRGLGEERNGGKERESPRQTGRRGCHVLRVDDTTYVTKLFRNMK